MASPIHLPETLSFAETLPATIKAALPTLTVMMVNGALNFLFAVLLLLAGWAIARWFGQWVRRLLARSHHVDSTLKPLISNFARYTVIAVTLVAVLGQFGVQTTSLIALLGAAGLAIGLALQGTLSNVASGVMLLLLRPFRVGDAITAGSDLSGTVREIGLFTTILITADMVFLSVPNSQIFGSAITNYSREETRRINIVVGIDYDDDIDKAQAILLDILSGDPRILKTPAPIAPVNDLGASSVNLVARAFVANPDYWNVYYDLQKAIKLRFDAAGITIPFPQQTASTRPVKDQAASAPPG